MQTENDIPAGALTRTQTPTSPRPGRAEMSQSTTTVAALSPRLLTAVHPSSSGLLAAAADELARRTGEMWEDDVTFVMERGRGADAAAASCHKAGWSMREAAREIAAALAVRAL